MRKFMKAVAIVATFVLGAVALGACEFPDQASEEPTLESVSIGNCYYNGPDLGRDVTVEIKNNMPVTSDPDVGSMIMTVSDDGYGNQVATWDDWSDEDGDLYYNSETDYNVIEPGQTGTLTYFLTTTTPPPYVGGGFAMWFFVDADGDGVNESDSIFADDVIGRSFIDVGDWSC